MTTLINVFSPSASNIFFVAAIAGVVGFVIGFFMKAAVLSKQKKRVASLEDEMLSNHSRILELEKQCAQLKEENAKLKGSASGPAVELKIS